MNTNAYGFLSKRKCFPMTGCLIFVLLMSQTSCRPSETDDVPAYNDGDYTDADDIEWQNFPIVETTTKDHPIIYYKEDIVSEDYDPNKENKSSSKERETEIRPLSRRKYKEISRRNRLNRTENYRYIKPEKVFFDVYPIEDDGIKEDDTKFNENDIHVEVISLIDDDNNNNNNNTEESSDSKRLLSKRPKKYPRRHRQRRDVDATLAETHEIAQHAFRHKRNPLFYGYSYPRYRGVFYRPQLAIYPVNSIKHTVKGIPHNPVSPGVGEYERRRTKATTSTTARPAIDKQPVDFPVRGSFTDEPTIPESPPIWNSFQTTTQRSEISTRPPRRPVPPIIHTGDEDYVPPTNQGSISNIIPSQSRTTTLRPPNFAMQGSASSAASASSAGNPNFQRTTTRRPPNFGTQGWTSSAGQWNQQAVPARTERPSISRTTTVPPPPSQGTNRGVSTCIWAISACCTRTENIRYQCFERLGCSGAFWDLNPCADDIFRLAVEAANQYLD